jgi:CRP/FNR family cyclic AMP-dependent transcriptional regulator
MPLRTAARVELLREIPLFAQCSKKELREIARVAEEIEVEEGDVLIREGAPGHDFYVVVDGALDVVRKGRGRVDVVGPEDFVGEMALLSRRPRNATVTAATSASLLRIGDADFVALLDRMPLLWLKVAGALADRVAADEYLHS